MSTPILATKLYIPPPRPKVVLRPRLLERLNDGLHRKLTLISAPAGFGKTTLLSEWIHQSEIPVAWISLDKGDSDPVHFLNYLIAALQTLEVSIGKAALTILQSPQPPPVEFVITNLINEITTILKNFVLVLDDYHLIDAKQIHTVVEFLLDHLPKQMHLIIATRSDPPLHLARLRGRDQLTEFRASDLCFTVNETSIFFTKVMNLKLTSDDIAMLESRTEGWIAGLQLAAISMQGRKDIPAFIKAFTGDDRHIVDYLVDEVLNQQPEHVQDFLLQTSILRHLSGPLCDFITGQKKSHQMLDELERANLFIIPLDNRRRWYRYHHLFADLLRQRLKLTQGDLVPELHRRASVWYEDNALEIEAFHHATAANDVERAARLIEGEGMPLHFRGAVAPVLNWLESLPTTVLDARPSLWVMYASALSMTGQLTGVEEKLQAAEAALQGAEPDDRTQNLVGHIAAIRALLAASQHQVETIIAQSRRALEYLHPDNLAVRTATIWKLGIAYQLQGDRTAASRAYTEAISISQASGNIIINIVATTGLGNVQEAENQLYLAAETYRRVLQLVGDPPLPVACEAYLGLARICYEWNDLDAAQQHAQQSTLLARQIENTDRFVACEVFLARLKLAQGDVDGAVAILTKAGQSVRQHNFMHRMPEVAAAQALTLLHQGNLAAASHLAQTHELPISQVRVLLAQGDTSAALAVLEPLRQQAEAKGWEDERLKVMVLQAVALHTHGEKDKAAQLLGDALALAEPGGFIRIFVDEGIPMAQLLSEAAAHGIMPDYIGKLLAVFEAEEQKSEDKSYLPPAPPAQPLIEPLSQRELEVLQLIAQGLSNREISERLFLALSTVKGHNRNIFGKLQVQRRTEAVARARELGLL
ncbi:MAG: LuxR C-terminal-related transcriptional regulator [Proteobacteria bacterium]|nr:LuxR C-terminal-related transcriptional regulator [Pseudomonadota bacterium]